MKTTLEIPDLLFRRAKSLAAARGQSLKQFVNEALREKLAGGTAADPLSAEPVWMAGFGKLKRLRQETHRIQKGIDDELGVLETEDRE